MVSGPEDLTADERLELLETYHSLEQDGHLRYYERGAQSRLAALDEAGRAALKGHDDVLLGVAAA